MCVHGILYACTTFLTRKNSVFLCSCRDSNSRPLDLQHPIPFNIMHLLMVFPIHNKCFYYINAHNLYHNIHIQIKYATVFPVTVTGKCDFLSMSTVVYVCQQFNVVTWCLPSLRLSVSHKNDHTFWYGTASPINLFLRYRSTRLVFPAKDFPSSTTLASTLLLAILPRSLCLKQTNTNNWRWDILFVYTLTCRKYLCRKYHCPKACFFCQ